MGTVVRPIPPRSLQDRLKERTDLTPQERRVRLVLDQAISAVSASKRGDYFHGDPGAFAEVVGKVFDVLWDGQV